MTERQGPSFEDISGSGIPFAPALQRILAYAPEEAARLNHEYIGSEHLLLALLNDQESALALGRAGFSLRSGRVAVEFIIGKGDRPSEGPLYLSPRAQKILEAAREKARNKGVDRVGIDEFASALFSENNGIAGGVLETLAISPSKAIRELRRGEICRHDKEFFSELERRLHNVSYSSREATSNSRPRDVDRRTEELLRKALGSFSRLKISEEDLKETNGMLASGPYNQINMIMLNKGLTPRGRTRLTLHFIGVIVTGNLWEFGLHSEVSSPSKDQRKVDSEADAWVQRFKKDLLEGPRGKTVYAQGIARALDPEQDPGYRTRRVIAGALEAGSNINP